MCFFITHLSKLSIELKILGSSASAPAFNRHHTAQVLQLHNHKILIDCGESTQLLLRKYGFKLSKITHIFISHLHGDHYYGLMGILSTMNLYGRRADLLIYGPPGLSEIIPMHFKYSNTTLTYDIKLTEWVPGESQVIYENNQYFVTYFPLNHRVDCAGYCFREKPKKRRIEKGELPVDIMQSEIVRLKNGLDILDDEDKIKYENREYTLPPKAAYSYAFCSDTKYDESILPFIRDVDMLYHESTFMEEHKERAWETFHATAKQAAQIAKLANVKKLLLGHFSNRYKDLDPLLKEAQEVFPNSYLALEGSEFKINY